MARYAACCVTTKEFVNGLQSNVLSAGRRCRAPLARSGLGSASIAVSSAASILSVSDAIAVPGVSAWGVTAGLGVWGPGGLALGASEERVATEQGERAGPDGREPDDTGSLGPAQKRLLLGLRGLYTLVRKQNAMLAAGCLAVTTRHSLARGTSAGPDWMIPKS